MKGAKHPEHVLVRIRELYLEDLTYKQIAIEVGLSKDAVSAILFRERRAGRIPRIAQPYKHNRATDPYTRQIVERIVNSPFSIRAVARRAGIDDSTIRMWMRGTTRAYPRTVEWVREALHLMEKERENGKATRATKAKVSRLEADQR